MTSPTPLLTLYSGDRVPQTHSLSMFSTKLHLRLRHAHIPYTTAFATRDDAPRKKLPFIKLAETGDVISDTALITSHLVAAGHLPDVGAVLSKERRATGYCLQAMVEDRLYYLVVSLAIPADGWKGGGADGTELRAVVRARGGDAGGGVWPFAVGGEACGGVGGEAVCEGDDVVSGDGEV